MRKPTKKPTSTAAARKRVLDNKKRVVKGSGAMWAGGGKGPVHKRKVASTTSRKRPAKPAVASRRGGGRR